MSTRTAAAATVRRLRGLLARLPVRTSSARLLGAPTPLDPETLTRFESRLAGLDPATASRLDPTTHAHDFRQPNTVTCGAACLVFARMRHDPPYAMRVVTGYDPRTQSTDRTDQTDRWNAEVLRMHRRVTGLRDHDGDVQLPWLRVVGTSPWGAARQMEGAVGSSGLSGSRYSARALDPEHLDLEFDQIAAAVDAGHSVPLYVGSDLRPAHVVLVVEAAYAELRVYEPSAGRMVRVDRPAFTGGRLRLAGWDVAWFAVLPD